MSKKHKVRYEGNLRGVFDTHAHLYDRRYEEKSVSIEALLENASASGVDKIVIPSDSLATSKLASSMAREYNGTAGVSLWSSVGVHPHEASSYDGNVEEELKKLIEDKQDLRIVAVGEIGLDYYYDLSPRDVQKDVFEKQIRLSYESDLPFILHERDATGECLEILRRAYNEGFLRSNPGVCHCCSMSKEAASELIRMGFYIGFDGPLTFANNRKGIELCISCPADRIVAETDSPYLTPEPNRGRTNEPGFVPFVIEKIAQIRGIDAEEMARITTENALRLYEI